MANLSMRFINSRWNLPFQYTHTVVYGQTGCQPKNSKVLMANGEWKNIQDIIIGDRILSPQKNGSYVYSKVVNTVNWKCNEMYTLYQKNGQKQKIGDFSFNHIFPILTYNKSKEIFNCEAKMLYRIQNKNNQNYTGFTAYAIPKYKERTNCEIEPYSLGAWLGDGHFSIRKNGSGKRYHKQCGITVADDEIINEMKKYYKVTTTYKKKDSEATTYLFSHKYNFFKQLEKYELDGKTSGTKYIPKEALLSDIEYRKKLLAGLIDTDGYLGRYKNKLLSYEITTKSKQLSNDILSLIFSLGSRATITKIRRCATNTKLKIKRTYYCVRFSITNINIPIKLVRKIKSAVAERRHKNFSILLTKKRKPETVYGFEIDSKSKWFITNNWVVTHNSGKCLDENTKIKVSINKKIKNIKIKDLSKEFDVLSYNFKNKEKEVKKAIKTYNGKKNCYEIILENGEKIIATKDHRFFTEKGKEIKVKNLKVGDNLLEIK